MHTRTGMCTHVYTHAPLTCHRVKALCVVTPQGSARSYLASASSDGWIKLWDMSATNTTTPNATPVATVDTSARLTCLACTHVTEGEGVYALIPIKSHELMCAVGETAGKRKAATDVKDPADNDPHKTHRTHIGGKQEGKRTTKKRKSAAPT